MTAGEGGGRVVVVVVVWRRGAGASCLAGAPRPGHHSHLVQSRTDRIGTRVSWNILQDVYYCLPYRTCQFNHIIIIILLTDISSCVILATASTDRFTRWECEVVLCRVNAMGRLLSGGYPSGWEDFRSRGDKAMACWLIAAWTTLLWLASGKILLIIEHAKFFNWFEKIRLTYRNPSSRKPKD